MSENYVIDTTIIMQNVLEEADTLRVQTLHYRATQPNDLVLHIPEFTLIECANVLWKQVRFHGETSENAQQLLRDIRLFTVQTYAALGLLLRALDIALAEHLRCPLIPLMNGKPTPPE